MKPDNFYPVSFFDRHYYKLVPTGGWPTLQIDGIQMHRTKNITPEKDALLKVETLGIKPHHRVLDICTGLGYTAMCCSEKSKHTTTIEMDRNVIKIAKQNPYSRPLFEKIKRKKIKLLVGDAENVVKKLPTGYFDCIMHDPPRYGMAENLYTERFYAELYRILKPGCRLFHYVGGPGLKYRKINIAAKVSARLKNAGFKKVYPVENIQGIASIR
ncbi:MAG: methyltransferase domain-containing protein [Elusimicrobiota bacterium]